MIPFSENRKERRKKWLWVPMILAVAILGAGILQAAGAASPKQKTYGSPEEAVQALVEALKKKDDKALLAIFGPESQSIILPKDKVVGQQEKENFLQDYEEMNKWVKKTENKMVLVIGKEEWPFPIPLVREGELLAVQHPGGKRGTPVPPDRAERVEYHTGMPGLC